jgi:RimJ/RimL family protein N-acetyltransferase
MLEPAPIWPVGRGYAVRPARAGDHRLFPARPDFEAEHRAAGEPLECGLPPGGWTLLRNERPIGIGWLASWEPGLFHCWAFLSDLSRRDWAYAAAATARALAHAEARLGARRIETLVALNNAAALRFAERLGFARGDEGSNGYRLMVREA